MNLTKIISIITVILLITTAAVYFTNKPNPYKDEVNRLQNEYQNYKDSANFVLKNLREAVDSIAKEKDKVKWKIVELPIYRSNIFTLSDSGIATKADSTFLSSTTFNNDSSHSFDSTKLVVIIDSLSDTTRAFRVHKNILIDYIVSNYELVQYKDLNKMNEKLLTIKDIEIQTLNSVWKKSESTAALQKIAYENVIYKQKSVIKMYEAGAVGVVTAGAASVLKATPAEIVLSGAIGFGTAYAYDTIKNWIF